MHALLMCSKQLFYFKKEDSDFVNSSGYAM